MARGDGETDVVDLSGNGKGVALDVYPDTGVVEYTTVDDFPVPGVPSVIYIDESNGQAYRWDGDSYSYEEIADAPPAPPVGDGDKGDVVVYGNGAVWAVPNLALKANLTGGNTFTGAQAFNSAITVPDHVYGADWEGSTQVPTKNAVYDRIQEIANISGGVSDGDKGDVLVSGGGTTLTVESTSARFELLGNHPVPPVPTVGKAYVYHSEFSGAQIIGAGLNFDCVLNNCNGMRALSIPTGAAVPGSASDVWIYKNLLLWAGGDAYGPGWNNNNYVPTKHAIYQKIESMSAGGAAVSDDVYGGTWNGATTVAPSQNAVYDKIESLILGAGGTVSDTAYSAGWNGIVATAPSQNAVYDEMEMRLKVTPYPGYPEWRYAASGIEGLAFLEPVGDGEIGLGFEDTACYFYGYGPTQDFMIGTVAASGRATLGSAGGWEFSEQPYFGNNPLYHAGNLPPSGISDGDKGDVVVSGSGATLTVESATPVDGSFNVAGSVSTSGHVTITATNPTVFLVGDASTYYPSVSFQSVPGTSVISGYGGLSYNSFGSHLFQTNNVTKASIDTVGNLSLQGGIYASGYSTTLGHSVGPVANNVVTLRNTNTPGGFTSINFQSSNPDGSADVTDAFIQAISGGGAGYVRMQGKTSLYLDVGAANIIALSPTLAASTVPLTVPEEAYGAGWNANLSVPTKNAVYDKIEAVVATIPAPVTSIVGITGTFAQFNTACTDADFARTTAANTFTGSQTFSDQVSVAGALQVLATNPVLELQDTSGSGASDGRVSFRDSLAAEKAFITASGGLLRLHSEANIQLDAVAVASVSDISVPDEVYGAGWNGSFEVPTKNAVYDKMQLMAPLTNAALVTPTIGGTTPLRHAGSTGSFPGGAVTVSAAAPSGGSNGDIWLKVA